MKRLFILLIMITTVVFTMPGCNDSSGGEGDSWIEGSSENVDTMIERGTESERNQWVDSMNKESDYTSDLTKLYSIYLPDENQFYKIELLDDEYFFTANFYNSDEYSYTEKSLTKEEVDVVRDLILADKLYWQEDYYECNKKCLDLRTESNERYSTSIQYSNGNSLDIKWYDDKSEKIYQYLYSLTVDLLTKDEFEKIMKDEYGMHDVDYEALDYDDFKLHYSYFLTKDSLGNLKSFYEYYIMDKSQQQYLSKFETVLIGTPDTDNEYDAFVKTYIDDVTAGLTRRMQDFGYENYKINYSDFRGYDYYRIGLYYDDGKRWDDYKLYIGKTDSFGRYELIDGKGYDVCRVYIHIDDDPGELLTPPLCYNNNGKFFMAIENYRKYDYANELIELFKNS